MYLPTHFEEDRVEVLHALIRAQPLGNAQARAIADFVAAGLDASALPTGRKSR